MYAAAESSPGSQNGTDGCTVRRYCVREMAKMTAAVILWMSLLFIGKYLRNAVDGTRNAGTG
jgi:hypothetical protein